MTLPEPVTRYFTFGFDHVHEVAGERFDKDVVVRITAPDPRAVMFETFGVRWAFQYDEQPDLKWYPRGVKELTV